MQYSKPQKILSFFLIFFLLVSVTLHVPLMQVFPRAEAVEKESVSLVSLLVQEEIYSGIASRLNRYAEDIQGVLENTRVVILPVPENADPFNIASLNESLYYDGYAGLEAVQFHSRLVGTVIFGDLPLPVVYSRSEAEKSIVPYTDFIDKAYIYDHGEGRYTENQNNIDGIHSEIWHGVISPNTGTRAADIVAINAYLDKNHDFYTAAGNFEIADGVVQAVNSQVSPTYEPYVFYYDQFRDKQSLSYSKYLGYEAYRNNIEDLTYARYTKELAERLQSEIVTQDQSSIESLLQAVDPDVDLSSIQATSEFSGDMPDMATRYITQNTVKKFLEIFNSSSLGEQRKDVYNAGRYSGTGGVVQVDQVPYLVSILDTVSTEIIKNVNYELEAYIDNLVQSGLSRKIAIPLEYTTNRTASVTEASGGDGGESTTRVISCPSKYINFLNGKQGEDISSAIDCSIYRGSATNSGQLVEANRGLNVRNIEADFDLCPLGGTSGYWGGNSPANLNQDRLQSGEFQLNSRDVTGAIRPLFDIAGSKVSTSILNTASPLNCLQNNYILVESEIPDTDVGACTATYRVPYDDGSAQGWTCESINQKLVFTKTFEENFLAPETGGGICYEVHITLDGELVKSVSNTDESCNPTIQNYSYKSIASEIKHVSPTSSELGAQVMSMVTPSLPIDRDRYVDFVGARGNYARIDYPQLFRVGVEAGQDMDLATIEESLQDYLGGITTNINTVIGESNPAGLDESQSQILEQLSTGTFPASSVSLLSFIRSKLAVDFSEGNTSKELSYYDTLLFALYWKNLNNISAKYKFIFEQYLSDSFSRDDIHYGLPKSKTSYEVAYIGAPGDHEHMYINLDPEAKGVNPFSDIVSQNTLLSQKLLGSNLSNIRNTSETTFKCAPPDGVPIWEWLPAIICWLGNMLPPTIGISDGDCGTHILSEEEKQEVLACNGDVNKNGVSDCLESKLTDGGIDFSSDSTRYFYNTVGSLRAVLKDSNGNPVRLDNTSKVNFRLTRLEVPDQSGNFSVVYDASNPEINSSADLEAAKKYLNFTDLDVQVAGGEAAISFSAKNYDVNASFQASLRISDQSDAVRISLDSDIISLQIRGDNLFTSMTKLIFGDTGISQEVAVQSITAANTPNVFLVDSHRQSVDAVNTLIRNSASSSEVGVLSLENISKAGVSLPLEYPLTLKLYTDADILEDTRIVTSQELTRFIPLYRLSKAGEYRLVVEDASGFSTEKRIIVEPDAPHHLATTLGASVMQTGGNITTNIVTIFDQYDNPVTGQYFTLKLSLDDDILSFKENNSQELELTTFEGYRAFQLQSGNDTGELEFSAELIENGRTLLTQTLPIEVLQSIQVDLEIPTNMQVGYRNYTLPITLKDASGNILSDLSSRVYFGLNSLYGKTTSPYFDITNGRGEIQFQTANVALQSIPVTLQIEGFSASISRQISILPETALYLDMSLSKSKIEASPTDTSYVTIELKDRYGNKVYTDNTTQLTFTIPEAYRDILTVERAVQTVSGGKTQFKLSGTVFPGLAHFKISSSPDIGNNELQIPGQAPFPKSDLQIPLLKNAGRLTTFGRSFFEEVSTSEYRFKIPTLDALKSHGDFLRLPVSAQNDLIDLWNANNTLVIHGIGEQAGSIESFYFWDKESVFGKKYNSIYSVLLGGPYGDISKQNYLGGALLYDRDNRSLAVTSLLNDPYRFDDVVDVNAHGHLSVLQPTTDMTQDIGLTPYIDALGNIVVDVYNDALSTYIGKVYYHVGSAVNVQSCSLDTSLASCLGSIDRTQIILQTVDTDVRIEKQGTIYQLKNSLGNTLVQVSESGQITQVGNVYLEVSSDTNASYQVFDIKQGDITLAHLVFQYQDPQFSFTKDGERIQNLLQNTSNSIIVSLFTNGYSLRESYDVSGEGRRIFYRDPFSTAFQLKDFASSDASPIENFATERGIGWSGENTALLAFAEGQSVGESTQREQSHSLINLGDPVVSLGKRKISLPRTPLPRSFDKTIGKQISENKDVQTYSVFDYNDDASPDVLFVYRDGYVGLLENDGQGNLSSEGHLAHIVDVGNPKLLQAGDFSGDGYEDIFFVNSAGKPFLLNNHVKDFRRQDIGPQFELGGRIIQSKVYDMDADGKDDIVTLDDSGEIHIFYGGGNAITPSFTKERIASGYGLALSSTPRNDGGLIYFSGVPQLNDETDTSELLASNEVFQDRIRSGNSANADLFQDSLVDRFIFERVPYGTEVLSAPSDAIGGSSDPEVQASIDVSKESLDTFLAQFGDNVSVPSIQDEAQTTFIKSEYSELLGLKVEKIFEDINGGTLQSGDTIGVRIRLINESGVRIRDLAYIESIDSVFTLQSGTIQGPDGFMVHNALNTGNFLVNGIELAPGETKEIRYQAKVLPIKYGFLDVGLFESGELGDDIFGDVIFKTEGKSCAQAVDIFRSIGARNYSEVDQTDTCTDGGTIPSDITDKFSDDDANGVPDYIDRLVNANQDTIDNYAETELDNLQQDDDSDGLPNFDDDTPNFNNESSNFMSSLGMSDDDIDEISAGIDHMIAGFGCGFGGGSCLAMPMNWAPLAPGSDPTVFGFPIGDGLRVDEGYPIFSALTWKNFGSPIGCIPVFHPLSQDSIGCVGSGAGGALGTTNPTNYVRLYVTPTITGAVGFAACFSGPVAITGEIPPAGLRPLFPGGNCVVAAVPFLGCSGDGSDGNPRELGVYDSSGAYGLINGNCSDPVTTDRLSNRLNLDFIRDYLAYKSSGSRKSPSLQESFSDAFSRVARGAGSQNAFVNEPLISMDGGGDNNFAVELDTSGLENGDFSDVIKFKLDRTWPFPDFLMNWVTRQLEEIVTKLTDFPTLFVILPDFSGLFDNPWGKFADDLKKAYDTGAGERLQEEASLQGEIDGLEASRAGMNCDGDNQIACLKADLEISKLKGKKDLGGHQTISGIRSAYEFLSNMPLVAIEPQTVPVNVPWVTGESIDKAKLDFERTRQQWIDEIDRAKESWSFGQTCEPDDTQCAERNAISERFVLDAERLIRAIDRNIEILNEYKNFPHELNKLLNIKQVRLEQILCNIDAISQFMGGWITENGKRFKSWIELIVLIKALLKSWQLLIDIFVDYDAECHTCKNERNDLMKYQFKLISMIIPDIPIVRFPKWPDIILDLHNIRAGLTVYLPEFDFNVRPIVFPTLPELHLPELPGAGLQLPQIPTLPQFKLPELPDLPSLPMIELPNLPPPPKLPKLFSGFEMIVNIAKLITKAMCILQSSPFVPEARAGDQIAFITERQGYLPLDFLDLSLPQFSFPFIDAIKVTSYVNFEFETDFLVEMARNSVEPVNTFGNNIHNAFQLHLQDLDFRDAVPTQVEVQIQEDGETDTSIGYMPVQPEMNFSAGVMNLLVKGVYYMQDVWEERVENREFIAMVNTALSNASITSDPRYDELRHVWEDVSLNTYSKEQELIDTLQKDSFNKFETLKSIVEGEIQEVKQLQTTGVSLLKTSPITSISYDADTQLQMYTDRLEPFARKAKDSALALYAGKQDLEVQALQEEGKKLVAHANRVFAPHGDVAIPQNLLADTRSAAVPSQSTCSSTSNDSVAFKYEGLYVLEGEQNYRLFDYTDNLRGDEEMTRADMDNDGDEEVIYMVDGKVFMKENLENTLVVSHISLAPLKVDSDDNRFLNGDVFYEAINGFEETSQDNESINVGFQAISRDIPEQYRMEFYSIVDASRFGEDINYVPAGIDTTIIDAIPEQELDSGVSDAYTLSAPPVYIDAAGDALGSLKLEAPVLFDIQSDIALGNIVNISRGTKIYAGDAGVQIRYLRTDGEEELRAFIPRNSAIHFPENVQIIAIAGSAYVSRGTTQVFSGETIRQMIGKPLFPGAKITRSGDIDDSVVGAYVELQYADGTQSSLDFREVEHYELYDLGFTAEDYLLKLDIANDYYYATLRSFYDGVFSTQTRQILLAPQREADLYGPDIRYSETIRVPVYQTKEVDFTDFVFEDSGLRNIADLYFDMNISEDSDGDGIANNDRDMEQVVATVTPIKVAATFGPYTELIDRDIQVYIEDANNNIGTKQLKFQVYAPTPQISNYDLEEGVFGNINETLDDEPVRLYRYRGGVISKIQTGTGGTEVLTEGGEYIFSPTETSSGLVLTRDGIPALRIEEETGLIEVLDPLLRIHSYSSSDVGNDSAFPKISVQLANGQEVYYQYLELQHMPISVLTDFALRDAPGIYMLFSDTTNYNYYEIPNGASYNPGSIVIYRNTDVQKGPLFIIHPDGRIDTANDFYDIEYITVGDTMGFALKDRNFNREVARVLYDVSSSFVMQ